MMISYASLRSSYIMIIYAGFVVYRLAIASGQ